MGALAILSRSLTAKFLTVNLSILFVSLVILFGILEGRFYLDKRADLAQSLRSLVQVQNAAFVAAVWEFNIDQIDALLDEMKSIPHFQGASVRGLSGAVLAQAGDVDTAPEAADLKIEHRLVFISDQRREPMGTLAVTFHAKEVRRELTDRVRVDALILIVMAGTLISATVIAIGRLVGQPLGRLHGAIERMRETGVREAVAWKSGDELGRVVHAYNEMQQKQAVAEAELKRYQDQLEELVARRTESRPNSQQRRLAFGSSSPV